MFAPIFILDNNAKIRLRLEKGNLTYFDHNKYCIQSFNGKKTAALLKK